MKKKIAELVFDTALYPRGEVDKQHVHYMRESLRAGQTLPPPLLDSASLRIVDGVHRYRAHRAEYGPDASIEVVLKKYRSEAEMFLDAVRYNATHGRALTTFDRATCVIRAEEFKIEPEQVATALGITCDAVGKLRSERCGKLRSAGGNVPTPLKRTISHMAGETLSKAQYEANDKLSGMQQAFYANQLILLIENKLLDMTNDDLLEKLRHLHGLLEELLVAA